MLDLVWTLDEGTLVTPDVSSLADLTELLPNGQEYAIQLYTAVVYSQTYGDPVPYTEGWGNSTVSRSMLRRASWTAPADGIVDGWGVLFDAEVLLQGHFRSAGVRLRAGDLLTFRVSIAATLSYVALLDTADPNFVDVLRALSPTYS
jgi:hypothetical protein